MVETITAIVQFAHSDAGVGILAGLLLISEALGSIQKIRANSVYQVVVGLLRKAKPTAPGATK